jgi:hypothetical protein
MHTIIILKSKFHWLSVNVVAVSIKVGMIIVNKYKDRILIFEQIGGIK